jgi:hypothetical protein
MIMAKMHVLGMKMFKGTVEGENYDSTTVFVRMRQDETKGTAIGYVGQDLRFGDSKNFKRFTTMSFPFDADIETETVSNGKGGMKTIIVDLKPIQPAKA